MYILRGYICASSLMPGMKKSGLNKDEQAVLDLNASRKRTVTQMAQLQKQALKLQNEQYGTEFLLVLVKRTARAKKTADVYGRGGIFGKFKDKEYPLEGLNLVEGKRKMSTQVCREVLGEIISTPSKLVHTVGSGNVIAQAANASFSAKEVIQHPGIYKNDGYIY